MTGSTEQYSSPDSFKAQSSSVHSNGSEPEHLGATLQVVAVTEHYVLANGQRQGGCSKCQQRKGCPSGALAKDGEFTIELPANGDVRVGDQLVLQCSERQLLGAFAVLFGLPLVGMVLLPLALEYWTQAITNQLPLITFIEVSSGFALGMLFSKLLANKVSWQTHYQTKTNKLAN
ncbi:hypothetical protein GCM10011369_17970 [Neiella marina]|uniref:SoxR reducing system RseC family protein n=1 Tax=Neiella marina TaxID=508461 RepID=A0A8J2U4R8_9GAMM|nr:SoxR reducing system RseC family protein [Neiella marina]GGA76491.1 hypothetical protein GCM10011369_17970 [Neiella marina]